MLKPGVAGASDGGVGESAAAECPFEGQKDFLIAAMNGGDELVFLQPVIEPGSGAFPHRSGGQELGQAAPADRLKRLRVARILLLRIDRRVALGARLCVRGTGYGNAQDRCRATRH